MRDVRLRAVPCNETQREGSNKLSPAKFLSPARDPFGRWVTNLGLRGRESQPFYSAADEIGKCIACLRSRRSSDVAPSQSATPCARKSHCRDPSPIETYRCPISREQGLVFRFSPPVPHFSPSRSRSLFNVVQFPSLSSFLGAHLRDHRSSFVRGVMGVPLLSGREHARKKTGKKSSPLVSVRSLHLLLLLLVHSLSLFFSIGPSFRTLSRFTVHAISFTCSPIVRAFALLQKSSVSFRSGEL